MPRVNTSTWGNRSHRFLGIRPIETPVNLGGKIPNQSRLQTCKPSTTNSNETTPTPISCRFQIRTCLPITIYYHVPTNHISPPNTSPSSPACASRDLWPRTWWRSPFEGSARRSTASGKSRWGTRLPPATSGHLCGWFNGKQVGVAPKCLLDDIGWLCLCFRAVNY